MPSSIATASNSSAELCVESNLDVALRAVQVSCFYADTSVDEVSGLAQRLGAMGEPELDSLRFSLKRNLAARWHNGFELAFYLAFWLALSAVLQAWLRTGPQSPDVNPQAYLFFLSLFAAGAGFVVTVVLYGTGLLRLPQSLRLRSQLLKLLAPAASNKALCEQAWNVVWPNPDIVEYRDSVLAAGRTLTLLDLQLMLTWSYKLEQLGQEQKREQAARRLHGQY